MGRKRNPDHLHRHESKQQCYQVYQTRIAVNTTQPQLTRPNSPPTVFTNTYTEPGVLATEASRPMTLSASGDSAFA